MRTNIIKSVISLFCIVILIFSPFIAVSQLPNLGTSIDFVLFTSAGALGNTGISTLTGDIGTNEGAITGFGLPTVVNGSIESANAVTAQCVIDVQAAYDEIFARTPTNISHAPEFGGGETLLPGVYAIGAAGSVGGSLTLDADNDPDAIFIFKFGGAFTTGASSTVNLINGASACRIFWIANGAIAMAASTDMKGTLIASGGAISMGAGGLLEGRMLSTVGEATVYEVTSSLPECLEAPLSVGLTSFSGSCDQKNIVLKWSTETEIRNDYFTIEQSIDGKKWNSIGTVAGAGSSSTPLHYSLTDNQHYEETHFYRLMQTDFNGKNTIAQIISIPQCSENGTRNFTISPNPTAGKFRLNYDGLLTDINSLEIFNSSGQNIYTSSEFQSSFDLSNYAPGIYVIRAKQGSKTTTVRFILTSGSNN